MTFKWRNYACSEFPEEKKLYKIWRLVQEKTLQKMTAMKIQNDVEIPWNLWQVEKQVSQRDKSSWIMEDGVIFLVYTSRIFRQN